MSIEELKDDIIEGKNIINEDEESVTSNFTIVVFKPRHSIDVSKSMSLNCILIMTRMSSNYM